MDSVLKEFNKYIPMSWSDNNVIKYNPYKLRSIDSSTLLYERLEEKVSGDFNLETHKIVEVENPYLLARFMLKKAEYKSRGYTVVKELFHDTASNKIPSIVTTNLDWRRASRVKFGKGVSFSPSPSYANEHASWENGEHRAMIIADVLIGKSANTSSSLVLPKDDCDTTIGNRGNVYVKYYDDEFYPKYVVYYTSM